MDKANANANDFPWGPEHVEILTTMWADKRTGSEIALVLNRSRNAVIGKAHRLKLEKRCVGKKAGGHYSSTIRRKPDKSHANTNKAHRPEHRAPDAATRIKFPAPPKAMTAPANSIHVTLLDRDPHGCCYPVNNGKPYLFCNAPAEHTYCEHHRAIMYPGAAIMGGQG